MQQAQSIETRLQSAIKEVVGFPKPGILFKDISPIFLDAELCKDVTKEFVKQLRNIPDAICVIESRGFFFGMLIAQELQIPLIPLRKKGKLPGAVRSFTYDLEYGSATLEVQSNILKPGWNILIHDDVLATGGTAIAAAELVKAEGANVAEFCFLMSLDFLNGTEKLADYATPVNSLVRF